jgi:uncharacterized protein (DUF362 family)/NAD-dependent dihydropyrimidine dehydrogenase PreA subunit
MQKSKVALVKCESYDEKKVWLAVARAIELLGGIQKFTKHEDSVLLKPNLLSPQTPDKAVTTHPSVFYAVGKYFQDSVPSLKLSYGDSAPKGTTVKILSVTGIKDAAGKLNIPNQNFEERITVSNPDGFVHKQFTIARPVHECDVLINIAKFKTHHLTRITAAVKNLFGCIPGLMKPEFHVKLPGVQEFSQMMVELDKFLAAKLHIIDAIEAMEGNGPNSGDSKKLNCIIVSSDPVAADTVASQLVDLKPERVLTNKIGQQQGLGNMENIEIVGENPATMVCKDFKVQRGINLSANVAWKYRYLKNLISLKPVINQTKCIKCGECVNHCPADPLGINWHNKSPFPVYDYHNCILCYCCQEVCPKGAIDIKTPFIRKIMDWMFA